MSSVIWILEVRKQQGRVICLMPCHESLCGLPHLWDVKGAGSNAEVKYRWLQVVFKLFSFFLSSWLGELQRSSGILQPGLWGSESPEGFALGSWNRELLWHCQGSPADGGVQQPRRSSRRSPQPAVPAGMEANQKWHVHWPSSSR